MKRVFVSYSHDDEYAARELKQVLDDHGFEAWLASDEIRPGQRVVDHVRESIRSAGAVVLLIGSEPSDWARYEWSQALELSWAEDQSKQLVPVVLQGADSPSFLHDRQVVRVAGEPDGWEQVAHALELGGERKHRKSDRGRLTRRLDELAKTAAALPEEPLLS